jgi:hypothetical protein
MQRQRALRLLDSLRTAKRRQSKAMSRPNSDKEFTVFRQAPRSHAEPVRSMRCDAKEVAHRVVGDLFDFDGRQLRKLT